MVTKPCGRGLLWVCDWIGTEDQGSHAFFLGCCGNQQSYGLEFPLGKSLRCSSGELVPGQEGQAAGDTTQIPPSVL